MESLKEVADAFAQEMLENLRINVAADKSRRKRLKYACQFVGCHFIGVFSLGHVPVDCPECHRPTWTEPQDRGVNMLTTTSILDTLGVKHFDSYKSLQSNVATFWERHADRLPSDFGPRDVVARAVSLQRIRKNADGSIDIIQAPPVQISRCCK